MRPAQLLPLTVQESVDNYVELVHAKMATGQLSPATAELYARDVATFARLAGPERILDDLTGQDLDTILLAFARKPDGRRTEPRPGLQSAASQARFRRSVSAFFRHAALTGWVQLDPMPTSTVHARERGGLRAERRALTREQAGGLVTAAATLATAPTTPSTRDDQRTGHRDALIVLLLATLGPRVSELVKADIEHFYTGDGIRYWRIFGKGGHTRDVPVPRPVATVLDSYLTDGRPPLDRGREPRALLLSWRGNRLNRGDVQAVINRVLAKVTPADRRSVTPHGLRHTTATHLLAAATDMDAVRRVLGHSDLTTLTHYRDELPGELEAAMRAHPLLDPTGTATDL
ncbi:tyrosine-type recombinase/integrase [Actinocorallia longicatena]|uniref:Site-specific recombinase XerD n=1 Tax=Actinocorallia longicatena TaxID=111803 RepID=A0ABP6QCP1_9ACTN